MLPPSFSTAVIATEYCVQYWDTSARKIWTYQSVVKGHPYDKETGASLIQGKAERAGTVQPTLEKTQEGFCQCI